VKHPIVIPHRLILRKIGDFQTKRPPEGGLLVALIGLEIRLW
jgi:hypothetical protein